MDYNDISASKLVTFSDMPPGQFLLGILSAFDNRYQAFADSYFKEITWKQFFAIICLRILDTPPTINELSEVMGSSHQNVKQILLKLEQGILTVSDPNYNQGGGGTYGPGETNDNGDY